MHKFAKDPYLLNSSQHLANHIMRSFSVARRILAELKERGCRIEIDQETWDVRVFDANDQPIIKEVADSRASDDQPIRD